MDWIVCSSCDEEFKIITDSLVTPSVCPFCGEDLEIEDIFDEYDDE